MAANIWFCYMVRCRDGSFYVGIAADVGERVERHNRGMGPEIYREAAAGDFGLESMLRGERRGSKA